MVRKRASTFSALLGLPWIARQTVPLVERQRYAVSSQLVRASTMATAAMVFVTQAAGKLVSFAPAIARLHSLVHLAVMESVNRAKIVETVLKTVMERGMDRNGIVTVAREVQVVVTTLAVPMAVDNAQPVKLSEAPLVVVMGCAMALKTAAVALTIALLIQRPQRRSNPLCWAATTTAFARSGRTATIAPTVPD